MRILVVASHEPWPLNSGGRLRLYNFLRWLGQDAAVTLVLPEKSQHTEHLPTPIDVVDAIASSVSAKHNHLNTVARAVRRHFGYSPALFYWLADNATPARYDVALLFGAVTGQYTDAVRVPVVWDAVDELVLYTARDVARCGVRDWPRTARAAILYALFERHVARRSYASVFASPLDASYARRWAGGTRIESISNGVDFDFFAPSHGPAERGTVAFVGSLSFPPNVEAIVRFATRIWPRIRADHPDRQLLVVGRAPVPAVAELAGRPGVRVHADVPDVRPYLARAAVVVVPTRLGGGVKNKVLEACAMARPVVASPRALAGLTARPGIDVVCASHPPDWVKLVSHLLKQPRTAAQVARHGHEWVRRMHNWPCLAGQLKELLASAAADGLRRPEKRPCPSIRWNAQPTCAL